MQVPVHVWPCKSIARSLKRMRCLHFLLLSTCNLYLSQFFPLNSSLPSLSLLLSPLQIYLIYFYSTYHKLLNPMGTDITENWVRIAIQQISYILHKKKKPDACKFQVSVSSISKQLIGVLTKILQIEQVNKQIPQLKCRVKY